MGKEKKVGLPKEELYEKYITENMTKKEVASYFGVSEKVVTRRLSEHGIIKDPKDRYKNVMRANKELYGCESSFGNPEVRAKSRKTMMERYGVLYTAQSKDLQSKMAKTMEERYGRGNYVETEEFREKSKETCLSKHGVETPCQYPQCVKALEEACGHSAPENEFASILDSMGVSYEREYSIRGFRYDFRVGDILFEIDPTGTHNSTFGVFGEKPKGPWYHFTKYSVAKELGFRCVHVFEWDDPHKIAKIFLSDKERVQARKCQVAEVPEKEAREFLEENHLQGYAKDSVRLGLYHEGKLVEIMTFGKPRYNRSHEWEIIRLCSSANVVGGAERLFSEFVKTYSPKNIISYCDLSKFSGKTYSKLGFSVCGKPRPSKHWHSMKTGKHITDNLLRQRGFDQLFGTDYGKGTDNETLMKENGFVEVYDCGQLAFDISL